MPDFTGPSGPASLSVPLSDLGLEPGTYALTAAYGGADGYTPSVSAPYTHVVLDPDRATSATVLVAPEAPVPFGSPVTLTARVEGADGTAPGGTVLFRNGPDPLGEATLTGGVATLSAALPVGTHQIAATYQGGTTHTPSTSAPVTVTVQPIPTTTTLTAPATSDRGRDVRLVARVVAGDGSVVPGAVRFLSGTTDLGTAPVSGGQAEMTVSTLPVGTNTLTAAYLGSADHAPSTSAPVAHQVVVPRAEWIEFVGGGTVFDLNAACVAGGWTNTPHPVRLRYGPGETNGMPSQVGILFPSGAEHLQTWQPLAQSTLNYDALGRQMWTLFVLQQPFPRMTPVQRRITEPANGTDIAAANVVMLRLRVSGFGGIPGCGATVAGVVRRGG